MPKLARFCPSCGASSSPVEMLGLEADAPIDTREVMFGQSGAGRTRRGLVIGSLVAALVVGGIVAVSRTNTNSASSPSTTDVGVATSSMTNAPSTTSTVPESTTTTVLPQRDTIGGGPVLGEATGLEVWVQASFGGTSPSPSGVYRIDLDSAVRDRLTSSMYFNGQSTVAAADANGLHMYGSGGDGFHVNRLGLVTRGPQVNGEVFAADRDGYWLQNSAESSTTGLPEALEHRRFDGSLISSVRLPSNSFLQASAGDGTFLVRGADFRSFVFDATSSKVRPLPGLVSAAAGGSVVTRRCSDQLDCPVFHIGADGKERVLSAEREEAFSFGPYGPALTWLSPDGAWVIGLALPAGVQRDDLSSNDRVLIDAQNPVTGERVVIGAVRFETIMSNYGFAGAPLTWSPDGRWVFVSTANGLAAWRPGLLEAVAIPLGEGPVTVTAVAVAESVPQPAAS
jgi:hypothetical protein